MNRFTPACEPPISNCKVASRFCVLLRRVRPRSAAPRHPPPHEKSNHNRKRAVAPVLHQRRLLAQGERVGLAFQAEVYFVAQRKVVSAATVAPRRRRASARVRTNETRPARDQCLHRGQLVTWAVTVAILLRDFHRRQQACSTVPPCNSQPQRVGMTLVRAMARLFIQPATTEFLPFINAPVTDPMPRHQHSSRKILPSVSGRRVWNCRSCETGAKKR